MKAACMLIAFTVLSVVYTNAQDTVWMSNTGKIVTSRDSAYQYEVVSKNSLDTQKVKITTFFVDGSYSTEAEYFPFSPKRILHGFFRRYYYGRLKEERVYFNGELNGDMITYWQNGNPKRKDKYEKGKLISGNCYRSNGTDTIWFEYQKSASFPGGRDSLTRFIQRNFIYPSIAKASGIEGVVNVQFIIAKDGSLTDINVVNVVDNMLANAAVQLVKKMPAWVPGMQDGELVSMRFILPVSFRLLE